MRRILIFVAACMLVLPVGSFSTAREPARRRELALARTRSGLLILRVSVDGREGNFIVDTGAEITLVDAKILFLSRFGAGRPDTAAKGGLRFRVKMATLCLCSGRDKEYVRMPVAVANLSGLERVLGKRIDGLLGLDFLRRLGRVTIDFESARLTVGGQPATEGDGGQEQH